MAKYVQKLHMDDNDIANVSIGQTRGGQDEWITPVALWERSKSSGLYLPPGMSDDVHPVKVQQTGAIVRDVLGYFSASATSTRYYFGATGPSHSGQTLQPLDIRGFKKISIHFLNGSPTRATRDGLRVAFYRTLDAQDPANAFAIAPLYEFANVPAGGSFRLLLTSDLSDLAGTPPDGLAIRYLPNLVGLVFSYDQVSLGGDGEKIILFSGVR